MAVQSFGVVDLVIFAVFLAVSVAIGVFYAVTSRRQNSSVADYLMARSKVKLVPVTLSLMASFVSAITIIGMPAEIFSNGTQYYLYSIGISLACIVSTVTFVPLLHPINFISAFEYIEKRFESRATRVVGAAVMCITQFSLGMLSGGYNPMPLFSIAATTTVIYIGTASLAPSTALEAVTGFPKWATILLTISIATLYTSLGGIRAVVWTDAFQSVIIVGGVLSIIIKGSIEVGGMSEVWRINDKWSRVNFINIDPNPTTRHTFWALIIGGCITWIGVYGTNQASIQRYCALPTLKQARISMLLNVPLQIVVYTIAGLSGMVIFAYYAQKGCDPISGNFVKDPNQIVPWFVMQVVSYPGVPGLFLSSLFSGALSTISSCLSALAAMGLDDFVMPVCGQRLGETAIKIISKIIVVVSGGIGMGIAFLLSNLGGTILQISFTFTSAASSPILGLFILAAAFPFANEWGAIVGMVTGLAMPMWIGIGKYSMKYPSTSLPLPNSACNVTSAVLSAVNASSTTPANIGPQDVSGLAALYKLSYLWLPTLGTLTTIILGIIVSLATGGLRQEVNRYYMFGFLPYGRRKYSSETPVSIKIK